MSIHRAQDADIAEVVALINQSYRGESSRVGWTTEADYIEGFCIDEPTLRSDLSEHPQAHLLVQREEPGGVLQACVWTEPTGGGEWYIGMLTTRPELQGQGVGRGLLAHVEAYARELGALRMKLVVLHVRDSLIAWYGRRGYAVAAAKLPFPYGHSRFGSPLRDDFHFVLMEKAL